MAKKLNFGFDFDEDYYVIECSSTLTDYQFAWKINQKFDANFRRINNFKVFVEKKQEQEDYALFVWQRLDVVSYFLVHPYQTKDLLMPVYYFLIQNTEKETTVENFIQKLQSMPEIISTESLHIGNVQELPKKMQKKVFVQRIEKIYNILFDLEEHLRELQKEEKKKRMERNKMAKNVDND